MIRKSNKDLYKLLNNITKRHKKTLKTTYINHGVHYNKLGINKSIYNMVQSNKLNKLREFNTSKQKIKKSKPNQKLNVLSILTPNLIASKQYAPLTKHWRNGIYSYNQNIVKNLPASDITVNALFRNYFTINTLKYNNSGKKLSPLLIRRIRLSDKRIYVSKPEIKHTNNTVNISVHLHNASNYQYMRQLLDLHKAPFTLSEKKNGKWRKNNFTQLKQNNLNKSDIPKYLPSKYDRMSLKYKNHYNNIYHFNFTPNYHEIIKQMVKPIIAQKRKNIIAIFKHSKLIVDKNRVFKSKRSFIKPQLKFNQWYKLTMLKTLNSTRRRVNEEQETKSKNITSYKYLNKTVRNIIKKFITLIRSSKLNKTNDKFLNSLSLKGITPVLLKTTLNKYYYTLNKYKLYNSVKPANINTPDKTQKHEVINKPRLLNTKALANVVKINKNNTRHKWIKPNSFKFKPKYKTNKKLYSTVKTKLSLIKLNALYKLYSYNGFISTIPGTTTNINTKIQHTSKLIWNTFNILNINKAEIKKILGIWKKKLNSKPSSNEKLNRKKTLVLKTKSKINKLNNISKNSRNNVKLRKKIINTVQNVNKFLEKYKDIISKAEQSNTNLTICKQESIKQDNVNSIQTIAQQNLENLNTLQIELSNNTALSSMVLKKIKLMYIYKYLSQNYSETLTLIEKIKSLKMYNAIYKNWFLNNFTNILSKIYNKKITLNIIKLKYRHLNSDIFSESTINAMKKNRMGIFRIILKQEIEKVVVAKVNRYSYDIHSNVYKFLENHYNKSKRLNLDIFNSEINKTHTPDSVKLSGYSPKFKIRHLNQVQASTINFTKYKHVFGARILVSGRLTKRRTASRSINKMRYIGSLRNQTMLTRSRSNVILNNNNPSNIQYSLINTVVRNGSYGFKGWINTG